MDEALEERLDIELLMTPGAIEADHLLEGLVGRPRWHLRAACNGLDSDMFFPLTAAGSDAATRVCVVCPVRGECLAFALPLPKLAGIWGGTTEKERRRLRRSCA